MNKYYEVTATIDGTAEVLFGSYDRNDCKYEVEAERDSWKADGYKAIKITSREVDEDADGNVYDTITQHELWKTYAPSFNFEKNPDELLAVALERGFVTKVGEDSYLINTEY
jgi:hypothetical protein